MPATNLSGSDADSSFYHVYNRGIEHKILFNDPQDYKIFLDYLKDYLSAPADPEATKKVFSIEGRSFRGTPHQPKNYLNKVELVAYCLMPSHFHLLLHQKYRDSLEGFIRSLCTRYSMYFNKKYQRSGPLFQGPYKSILVNGDARLLYLTRYLHTGEYSSYPEYLGARVTSWVKPQAVLSSFYKIKTDSFKGARDYKDFVEKYAPGPEEKEVLEQITLENENQHLEMSVHASDVGNPPQNPQLNISELLVFSTIFLLLLALGIRNVRVSTAKITPHPSPTPLVLSKTVEVKPITMLTIKIDDESASVNIRQQPSVSSNKIGQAKHADTFEFVSLDSGWYEIKLADGSTGFISASYIEVIPE